MSDEIMSEAEAEAVMANIAKSKEILSLSDSLQPVFAGRAPEVVSAVLADLLAIWMRGYRPEAGDDLAALRRELFEGWSEMFWDLVSVEDILAARQDKAH
jgi:hypothetical protein